MATEDVKPNSEPEALFTQLAEPFDPSEIKWRATHTNCALTTGTLWQFRAPEPVRERSCPFQKDTENRIPELNQIKAQVVRIRPFQNLCVGKHSIPISPTRMTRNYTVTVIYLRKGNENQMTSSNHFHLHRPRASATASRSR